MAVSALAVGLLIAVLLTGASRAAGAIETDTFSLTPSPLVVQGFERRSFTFNSEAGGTVGDAVRVANTSDETRRFRLYGADATRDPQTHTVVVDPVNIEPRGVASWIEFAENEIEIPAGAWQVVPFTITRPPGSTAEGMGAVVAEEVLGETATEGVDLVYRLAMLVRLGGDVAGLRVGEPQMAPPVELFPASSELAVTLTNEAVGPVRGVVRFTAGGLTGRYWEVAEEEVRLEAGETADVTATWGSVPRWGGLFSPAVEVTWEGGSVVRTGPRTLHPPLWLLALAILVIGIRATRELHSGRGAGDGGGSDVLTLQDAPDPEPATTGDRA